MNARGHWSCLINAMLVSALLVVLPNLVHAQDEVELPSAELQLKDGRAYSGGFVRQDPQKIILLIAGIETPFDQSDVASLEIGKTISQEYAERKAALDQSDQQAWYDLAYFLFRNDRLDDARIEAYALVARHPEDQQAKRLKSLIDSRLMLLSDQSVSSADRRPTRDRQPGTNEVQIGSDFNPSPAQEGLFWLTANQINSLRVWELPTDLEATKPRIVVPREIIDELFNQYPDHPSLPKGRDARNRFRAMPGWQQMIVIFELRARDLYDSVQVTRDPPALQDFRAKINPGYVVGYFRQHFGTGQVPGLYLHRYRPNTGPSAMANFLSLCMATYEEEALINRSQPRRSLLLQWGLPRDEADVPAPLISGWRPFFTGRDDPRFIEYAEWIDSLYEPMPDYGIDYNPPSLQDVLNAETGESIGP